MLLTALVVGLVISIFQAATQINEATLQFVPKLVVMFLVLLLMGPWMLQYLVDYIQRSFQHSPDHRMITLTSVQLEAWIAAFIYPLSRILGLVASAPSSAAPAFPAAPG